MSREILFPEDHRTCHPLDLWGSCCSSAMTERGMASNILLWYRGRLVGNGWEISKKERWKMQMEEWKMRVKVKKEENKTNGILGLKCGGIPVKSPHEN